MALGVDFPFFSTVVLVKNLLFSQGFWWFSRKKDLWKEWKWFYPQNGNAHHLPKAVACTPTAWLVRQELRSSGGSALHCSGRL